MVDVLSDFQLETGTANKKGTDKLKKGFQSENDWGNSAVSWLAIGNKN